MKLIVISPSRNSETEIKTVITLFENGLETFHLRKPHMRTKEMQAYLEKIPVVFHNRIVIHSHHKLASKFNLKGIHLAKVHFRKRLILWWRIRSLLLKKPNLTVSTSYHRLASVYEAERRFYYIFLGTIFDKVSGGFNAGYSIHSLRACIQKSNNKIVARGGTNVNNISICHELGFDGMAFSSAIWKAPDPVKAFCELSDRFRNLNLSAA